ncbi:MAG TPA: DUF2309 domain-containing protein [Kofleriaceae bacterium]|jgi:uncharacterized protein YbcC (UPF0753/DUF2309 family)|nr:DUF2309 domain-containing protein [Kofleriaceae bacterium]
MSDITGIIADADKACARIAPTWPLDRFIAVNPFWPLTNKPVPVVAGDLAALSGARLLMPREWYAQEWRAGRVRSEHLKEAIAESESNLTEDDLIASFWIREPAPPRRPLVVDVMDSLLRREHELTWREFVMERLSRFCASYFDDGQAQINGVREGGFYATWRPQAVGDQLPNLFMALEGYRKVVVNLPRTADEMIVQGCSDLGVPVGQRERYLTALLLDVNGWSSWAAYLRWIARQEFGVEDTQLRELLAVRLAWEWILFLASDDSIRAEWRFAMTSWPAIDRAAKATRSGWVMQRAVEIAWLAQTRTKLIQGFGVTRPPGVPRVQAAFCLDVRSEIFRRAFEAQDGGVQTYGVAGFFGVPIEYVPLAADHAAPHLPGVLSPKYRVVDTGVEKDLEETRRARLDAANSWKAFKSSSLSSFAYVDAVGLFFARKLFRDAFRGEKNRKDEYAHPGLTDEENLTRVPRLTSHVDGDPLTADERCDIAAALLRTMGLTRNFARLVLLIGHGSETKNNAYAAGIDCGACGGHPGDVNARAAAALLNDAPIRAGLADRGIAIPNTTFFVPGLHNTTTDEVTLFDFGAAVGTHQQDLDEVRALLARAGAVTRRERAPRLGLGDLTDEKLHAAVVKRATNWAEVRPEWGLAGNAGLIIAPRERTMHANLEGRAFLHDYRVEEDKDFSILEAIMLGPMVVGHWINFQYYASTVDNMRYGSGNKVLHNIVGGHLGVFEGNGGDLRIGLSLQSINDGERWVHSPLRLAVFIEAPREAIDNVIAKHAKLKELVENEWLHLYQLDAPQRALYARRGGTWKPSPG